VLGSDHRYHHAFFDVFFVEPFDFFFDLAGRLAAFSLAAQALARAAHCFEWLALCFAASDHSLLSVGIFLYP
jgi:hypothetical protein